MLTAAMFNVWIDQLLNFVQSFIRHDTKRYLTIMYFFFSFLLCTEFYYWDSYWVIEGLLLCDMYQTARGMIDNFLYMVKKYGFIPNGGRIYYLMRSQPPLLHLMVRYFFSYCL